MSSKRVDRHVLFQRTDQLLTFSKAAGYTMVATDGENLTAYLYDEDSHTALTSGIDVTSGSPTGGAEDTTFTITLDTSTGISLSEPTWYALYVVGDGGTVLLPNAHTADKIMILLTPQPS